jgi:glycosyltransferase involved in cell wall biosynthesis
MGSPVAVAANDSVAYVGRLSPEKGVVMLAETATRIGAKLTFVGDGEERNRIEAIAPGARITGWLNADGVRAELRRARALILPSLWYEVMPLVVMEAAALGVPSIVPDTCGAVEEVEHERTGLIFRGASAEALAESIARLGDDRLVASLGSAAHDRYWSRPASLDSHLDDLLDIYERILAQRPRS